MNIIVIGCGRWGTFIAWYLDKINNKVTLYGRESSNNMKMLIKERKNDFIKISDTINLSTDLSCVNEAETIVISINSQGLQGLMDEFKILEMKNKNIVLCMKGIEISTKRRLSQIVQDNLDSSNKVAVWLGPGHVQAFYKGIPNCMVIDSNDEELKKRLVNEFSSNLIRFYFGQDLIGNEVGAAAKNVIGIAAGILDGLELSSIKGALMSRGTREIARLIKAMGGNELSAYGLCHLGDYEATLYSKYSHNRRFGEAFVKNEKFDSLAEGYYTVKALIELGKEYDVDLPICNGVYEVIHENINPKYVIDKLFSRSLTNEY